MAKKVSQRLPDIFPLFIRIQGPFFKDLYEFTIATAAHDGDNSARIHFIYRRLFFLLLSSVNFFRHLKIIKELLLLNGPYSVAVDAYYKAEAKSCYEPVFTPEESEK